MDYEDYSQWLEDYEKPGIDSLIVGYSGIDPGKKVKAAEINHEGLDGLLGGDWAGHYHLTSEQVRKLEGYQAQIDRVESEANAKITAIQREATAKITQLREEAFSEIERVENEAAQKITILKTSTESEITRLDEKVTETHDEITERMSDIEDSQDAIKSEQELISARFEEVLEGVTEDAEILDARVDAEAVTHKNLGSNIRNLHRLIIALQYAVGTGREEFEGLLEQFKELAQAQIDMELNDVEAHDRRKQEIQTEALARLLQDDGLQEQINKNATAILELVDAIHNANERRRTGIENEEADRKSEDDFLQGQIDDLSRKLSQWLDELREDLQGQVNQLFRESESAQSEIASLHDNIANINDAIDGEVEARAAGDLGLARQVDENATAIIQTGFNVVDAEERLNRRLTSYNLKRVEADDVLQTQIDKNAEAIIETVLNSVEAHERLKNELTREELSRVERDNELQSEIDTTSTAILENVANIAQESEQRRELAQRLIQEVEDRERAIESLLIRIGELYEIPLPGIEARFANLQSQSDENAVANIWNSNAIAYEAEQRRKWFNEVCRELKGIVSQIESRISCTQSQVQKQINTIAEGVIENSSAIHYSNEVRRNEDETERFARYEDIQALLKGINAVSETCLEMICNIFDMARKVEEIEESESTEGTNFDDDVFDEAMADLFGN